jgi:VanZ family protein
LLAATPVIDLLVLGAAIVDLNRGVDARVLISWADARFAHSFAGAPAPARPARSGREHAARERREWFRHVLAWAIGSALLGLGILLVGDADRTDALISVAALWTLVLVIDFAISFSYTLWPRKAQRDAC